MLRIMGLTRVWLSRLITVYYQETCLELKHSYSNEKYLCLFSVSSQASSTCSDTALYLYRRQSGIANDLVQLSRSYGRWYEARDDCWVCEASNDRRRERCLWRPQSSENVSRFMPKRFPSFQWRRRPRVWGKMAPVLLINLTTFYFCSSFLFRYSTFVPVEMV